MIPRKTLEVSEENFNEAVNNLAKTFKDIDIGSMFENADKERQIAAIGLNKLLVLSGAKEENAAIVKQQIKDLGARYIKEDEAKKNLTKVPQPLSSPIAPPKPQSFATTTKPLPIPSPKPACFAVKPLSTQPSTSTPISSLEKISDKDFNECLKGDEELKKALLSLFISENTSDADIEGILQKFKKKFAETIIDFYDYLKLKEKKMLGACPSLNNFLNNPVFPDAAYNDIEFKGDSNINALTRIYEVNARGILKEEELAAKLNVFFILENANKEQAKQAILKFRGDGYEFSVAALEGYDPENNKKEGALKYFLSTPTEVADSALDVFRKFGINAKEILKNESIASALLAFFVINGFDLKESKEKILKIILKFEGEGFEASCNVLEEFKKNPSNNETKNRVLNYFLSTPAAAQQLPDVSATATTAVTATTTEPKKPILPPPPIPNRKPSLTAATTPTAAPQGISTTTLLQQSKRRDSLTSTSVLPKLGTAAMTTTTATTTTPNKTTAQCASTVVTPQATTPTQTRLRSNSVAPTPSSVHSLTASLAPKIPMALPTEKGKTNKLVAVTPSKEKEKKKNPTSQEGSVALACAARYNALNRQQNMDNGKKGEGDNNVTSLGNGNS